MGVSIDSMKKIFLSVLVFSAGAVLYSADNTVFFYDAGGVYYASSELEKPVEPMEIGKYSPKNLFDNDPATSWVEGENGPGTGSYVFAGMGRDYKKCIGIYNGYQASDSLFKKNNRVRKLEVSLYAGFTWGGMAGQFGFEADTERISDPFTVVLEDRMGEQKIELPFDPVLSEEILMKKLDEYTAAHSKELENSGGVEGVESFFFLKLKIVSVYKGSKWDDTCIAGIDFYTSCGNETIPDGMPLIGIFTDPETGNLYVVIPGGKEFLLADRERLAVEYGYAGTEDLFSISLMDVSPGKDWAIIDYQSGGAGGGRIEETRHLWSVRRLIEVPEDLLKRYGSPDPLGFTEENGRLYLETFNGKRILLEDIAEDLERMQE